MQIGGSGKRVTIFGNLKKQMIVCRFITLKIKIQNKKIKIFTKNCYWWTIKESHLKQPKRAISLDQFLQ